MPVDIEKGGKCTVHEQCQVLPYYATTVFVLPLLLLLLFGELYHPTTLVSSFALRRKQIDFKLTPPYEILIFYFYFFF